MANKKTSASLQKNPLVNPPKTKFNMPAWHLIKPEHFRPAVEWAIEQMQNNLDAIRIVPLEKANFENTVAAYESCDQALNTIMSVLGYYTNNATTKELTDLEVELDALITPLQTEAEADTEIFKRVERVYANSDKLGKDEKRLTQLIYKGLVEGPASLSDAQRARYIELQDELSEKSAAFKSNILTHMDKKAEGGLKFEVKKEDIPTALEGVSDDLIELFQEDNGDVIIGALPESIDVLEQCKNRETRKQLHTNYAGRGNIGALNNDKIASDIHQIKQEIAQLFGHKNVVEETITPDNRAAQSPENVWNILHRMRDVGYRASVDIHNELLEIAKEDGITEINSSGDGKVEDHHLQPWDVAYYLNVRAQREGGIDPQEEKKYFEVGRSMEGLKRSMKRRYGLDLHETNDFKMPSDDMQVFYSKTKSGKVDGIFIVDLYQRDNKRDGAWMDQLRAAGVVNGQRQVPITLVNCNYAVPKDAQYVKFDDIETLYHEFGHGVHGHRSQKSKYPTLNTIDIAWDAVELPSQFNEIFAAHCRHFNSYARHRDTGEKMPKDLYEKLTEKKASTQLIRQNQFGMMDMMLYTQTDKITSMLDFNKAAFNPTLVVPDNSNNAMINAFTHIITGGYSAGYYSYLYADFMVAAMEDLFEKHGQKAVNALKQEFISVGCKKDAGEAFDNVYRRLGEDVKPLSPDGYLRKNGYGKYVDQADAEGTSGENVPFDINFNRPKVA